MQACLATEQAVASVASTSADAVGQRPMAPDEALALTRKRMGIKNFENMKNFGI